MRKWSVCGVLLGTLLTAAVISGAADATCPTFPYPFTNGMTADATQFNANFANVITCFAPLASPSFTGNVGIGTTSPSTSLDVNGDVTARSDASGQGLRLVGRSSDNFNWGPLVFQHDGITYEGGLSWTSNGMSINVGTSLTAALSILNNGDLGIGTTAPSYLLQVGSSAASGAVEELQNSSGACTHTPGASSETVSCSSDARLKSNIQDASSALPWLGDMRIRDFTVKSTGERKTGVVAQEIGVHHPDMVHKSTTGFYSVDEPNPWLLVKSIQELHGIISQQQAEIEQLRTEVAGLKSGK